MRAWFKYYNFCLPCIDEVVAKYFPIDIPPVKELMSNVQLIFTSTHSAMGFETPRVPTVVEIGGLHIKSTNPLPKDLQAFMDSAKDGIVYFSLGSVIPESTMKKEIRSAIVNTFRSLKQKVLWKMDGNSSDMPDNVMMSKWFPQQSILGNSYTSSFLQQNFIKLICFC